MKKQIFSGMMATCLLAASASLAGQAAAQPQAAAAKPQASAAFTNQEVLAKLNGLANSQKLGLNRYNNKNLAELYAKYFAENGDKMTSWQKTETVRRIVFNAARISPEAFAAAVKQLDAVTPDNKGTQAFHILGNMLGPYNNPEELPCAERLFEERKELMSADQRVSLYPRLIKQSLRYVSGVDAYKKYTQALLAEKPAAAAKPDQVQRFQANQIRALIEAIGILLPHEPAVAAAEFEAHKAKFTADQIASFLRFCLLNDLENKDRKQFDADYAKLMALPFSEEKFKAVSAIGSSGKGTPAFRDKLIREFLKTSELAPKQRFGLILQTRRCPGLFNYGFHSLGSYENAKAITLEAEKLLESITDPKLRPSQWDTFRFYQEAVSSAFAFGDWEFGDNLLAKADKIYPFRLWRMQASRALQKGQNAEVVKICDAVQSSKQDAAAKTEAAVLKYFIQGGTYEGFDQAFADKKMTSAQKMGAIRLAGRQFFVAKRFEEARKLNAMVFDKMFKPLETQKVYPVRYQKGAPKTAEAWAKSPAYQDWFRMETRFEPYNGYDINAGEDARHHLKDAAPIPLDDAYKTGLQIVYDESGVHIYVRSDDPKVEEVALGQRGGPSLEWVFRPGDAHAYNSFHFGSLPGTEDIHLVNWAAPTKHYRLVYDQLTKDAVITPEGFAAHVFIPWMMVYDKLPAPDNVWRVGLQVWGKGTRSLSGLVHELARSLQLRFEFTPQQMTDLKRVIARTAFNRYNGIRQNAGAFIQTWNDPLLGDPAFYKAELKDFIADLDAAGKRLTAPAPDAEIDGIFNRYVPLWAEINYVVADKRAEYLRNRLFQK